MPTSTTHWQTVTGPRFTFEAPAGWKVERGPSRVSATHGPEVVQVSTFPLAKPYSDKLFAPVAAELRARMEQIARQTAGKLSVGPTVTAGGVRSHSYDVTASSQVDEYTFVFSGKREHLLLCRRTSSGDSEFCARLVTSFELRG